MKMGQTQANVALAMHGKGPNSQEATMSRRHRAETPNPLTKAEIRAHAHRERHRVREELERIASAVGNTIDVDECDEPGVEWRAPHHHEHHHAKERTGRIRHWKLKAWKRRSAIRKSRSSAAPE